MGVSVTLSAGGSWGCSGVGGSVCALRVGILAFLFGILLGLGWVEVNAANQVLVALFVCDTKDACEGKTCTRKKLTKEDRCLTH